MSTIPIYQPFLGEEETRNVALCMKSSWISSKGSFIEKFEKKTKEFIGSSHASSVSNGTVALHLALLAAGVGPGDEVITTNFTYVASTNAILMVGAIPVFNEIDPLTWNIDTNLIEHNITNKTKAILVTNVYGVPCEFDELNRLCLQYDLSLIEDAAESFGATYRNKKSGTLADISTFSFFGNKTITTGEGGMVLTNSEKIYNKVEQLKNQGNSPSRRYYHEVLGYNYRMTNIQAAIGCGQLSKINQIQLLKQRVDNFYRNGLKDLVTFQYLEEHLSSSNWMTSVLFKDQNERKKVEIELNKNKVETRPLFYPIDELPYYNSNKECLIAKNVYKRGLTLPSFPSITDKQLSLIINIIKKNV